MKNYRTWLWAAVVFLLLTAAIHATSFLVSPVPDNETERQLHELFTTYQKDLGGGFHRTFSDLFIALSSCFSFVCLLGGLIGAYLLRKNASTEIVRGITLIQLIVFGAMFVVMVRFTFLPPIILTGLIVLTLAMAYIMLRFETEKVGPQYEEISVAS
jgi:hypothetical protein